MKALILFFVLLFVSPVIGQVAEYGGRTYTPENFPRANWCQCGMCENIRSQWARTRTVERKVDRTVTVQEPEKKTETRYRTERYQVKVCRGGVCYYEWRTRRVAYQAEATEATESEADPVKRETVAESEVKKKTVPKDLVPTPPGAVEKIVALLNPGEGDLVVDAGCGDGRFLISAAEAGATAVGVELDPEIVALARQRIAAAGSSASVFQGDALEWDYRGADIVVIYQMPDLVSDIVARIPKGVRVASYSHDIPAINTRRIDFEVDGKRHSVFVGVAGDTRSELRFGL
jgi:SAM-dependent methyltransferase